MNIHRNRLILVLLFLLVALVSPLRASIVAPSPGVPIKPTGTFFDPSTYYGEDSNGDLIFYLDHFGVFTLDLNDFDYVYKLDFGWLYNFGGTTNTSDDVYLYDFKTNDVLYTAATLYPYFYSFNMDTFLYYFEGSSPRAFYNFSTDSYINYPLVSFVD